METSYVHKTFEDLKMKYINDYRTKLILKRLTE